MTSGKAKKNRKLEKKKKKLTKPLKETERETSILKKLMSATAHFDRNFREGKVATQGEVDPGDEKALKVLRMLSPPCEPTTSDMDVRQFRTNHIRKASANPDPPKVEQPPWLIFWICAPPPQKPPPSDGPHKSLVLARVRRSTGLLERPASSTAPSEASRQLKVRQAKLLLLLSNPSLTVVTMVALNITQKQYIPTPFNSYLSVNLSPARKFNQNFSKPLVCYYHPRELLTLDSQEKMKDRT